MKGAKRNSRKITLDELKHLSFTGKESPTINASGMRMEWVGNGWVQVGPADGTEDAVVIE